MKLVKYFFEYIIITVLFIIFKIIGYKNASELGEKIDKIIGPLFRSKKKIINNLKYSNIGENDHERNKIIKDMWGNYGRILAEYPYLKKFNEKIYNNNISIEGL